MSGCECGSFNPVLKGSWDLRPGPSSRTINSTAFSILVASEPPMGPEPFRYSRFCAFKKKRALKEKKERKRVFLPSPL